MVVLMATDLALELPWNKVYVEQKKYAPRKWNYCFFPKGREEIKSKGGQTILEYAGKKNRTIMA